MRPPPSLSLYPIKEKIKDGLGVGGGFDGLALWCFLVL